MRLLSHFRRGEHIKFASGNNGHSQKFRITMWINRLQIALLYHFDTENPKYEVIAGGLCVAAIMQSIKNNPRKPLLRISGIIITSDYISHIFVSKTEISASMQTDLSSISFGA